MYVLVIACTQPRKEGIITLLDPTKITGIRCEFNVKLVLFRSCELQISLKQGGLTRDIEQFIYQKS